MDRAADTSVVSSSYQANTADCSTVQIAPIALHAAVHRNVRARFECDRDHDGAARY
jgi:hypothetical protein